MDATPPSGKEERSEPLQNGTATPAIPDTHRITLALAQTRSLEAELIRLKFETAFALLFIFLCAAYLALRLRGDAD